MAEIGSGAGTGYPAAKDTDDVLEVDSPGSGRTLARANVANDLAAAVVAIEGELGTDPAGSAADLKTRLAIMMNNNGSLKDEVRVVGTGSLTTIQDAIDDLPTGGGKVFIPKGTYSVDTITTTGVTSLHLQGAGMGVTKISFTKTSGSTGVGVPVIKVDAKTHITISDLEIDGNATTDGGSNYGEFDHGIHLSDTNYAIIEKCWIHDVSGDGIYLADCDKVVIRNCVIEVPNLQASGPLIGRNGISVVEGSYITIANNIITGGLPAGIDIEPNTSLTVEHVKIIGNIIINATDTGIALNDVASGATVQYVDIENNHIQNAGDYGIRSEAKTTNIVGNTVHNTRDTAGGKGHGIDITNFNVDALIGSNDCYSNAGSGIYVHSGGERIQITGNRCHENQDTGISVIGISGTEAKYPCIVGNTCINNSQSGAGNSDGINLSYADNFLISSNQCYDDQGTPTQRYGILVQNSDDGLVVANFCKDNVTGQMNVNPANVTGVRIAYNFSETTDENESLTGGRAGLGGDYRLRLNSSQEFAIDTSGGSQLFAVTHSNELGFHGLAPVTRDTGWTTFANLSTDRTCDVTTTTVTELANILGTLIEKLKLKGLIGA